VSPCALGASGASRAVVLVDGFPLNDPFGGWVYWDRVPRSAVSQVEVLRGGASNLYGSSALSGAVNIITRSAESNSASLDLSFAMSRLPTPPSFSPATKTNGRAR